MTKSAEFAAAVSTAFGERWRVEPDAGGFTAVFNLWDHEPSRPIDEFIFTVTVDEASGVFSYKTQRVAGGTRVTDRKGPASFGKDVDSLSYSGTRQTYTFSRTPGGLKNAEAEPSNFSARERELVSVGTGLSLKLDPTQPPLPTVPNPKKMLVIVGAVFVTVLVLIGGVATAILTTVM